MNRLHRLALAVFLTLCTAAPLVAQDMQMSEAYNFLKAVRARDGTTVESIVRNPSSSSINVRDQSTGEGALHIVAQRRDLEWLTFLLSRGARPDIQMSDGTTPLQIAAQIGWVEGAQQLLDRRARVDLPNNRGETPLIMAVQQRQFDMVRLLLSRGASPDRQDSSAGYSALDYARQDTRNPELLRILQEQRPQQQRPMIGPTPN
jgi:uncharacterized protein